jgi:DNA (cytosine-5)-methyltransferase 1
MRACSVFSFFTGIGFLDLGFEKAGFKIARINEYNADFLEAYIFSRKKLGLPTPNDSLLSENIEELLCGAGLQKLKRLMVNVRGEGGLCGFIGGPPCPDFSVGGKNRGKGGDNGRLTGRFFDLITRAKPDWFLFENVKGLWRTKIHREFYDQMKHKAKKAGYLISDKLSNSLNYGAAQDRERIIMIGLSSKLRKTINDNDWMRYMKFHPSELQNVLWPKTHPFRSRAIKPENVPNQLTVAYWFKKNCVETHPNSKMVFKPRAGLKRFLSVEEGDDSRKSYKRLHRYRYSPTACYGNNEVHLHPTKPRRISVAEALAIQTAPKQFELPGTMTLSAAFKTIGNGVPVVMAESLARMIHEKINE